MQRPMLLLLATVLASTPVTRTNVHAELDVGGLVGASWYVPMSRERIELALQHSRQVAFGDQHLDPLKLVYALPMLGPWMTTGHTDDALDNVLLITTGILQTLGLGLAASELFQDRDTSVVEAGPLISLSPIAGGRLGLSVRITGF
jgi:hypothetical protein